VNWFRNWLDNRRRARQGSPRLPLTQRPTLEILEGRAVPSINQAVSSAVDSGGNTATLDVHTDGTLWQQYNQGSFVRVDSNVKSVSASTSWTGDLEAFVVYKNGTMGTLYPTSSGQDGRGPAYSGVSSVVAEPDSKALVIDQNKNLWQYDYLKGVSGPSPWTYLDSNVWQATPLTTFNNGEQGFADLHTDGTVHLGFNGVVNPLQWGNGSPVGNIQSIAGDRFGDLYMVNYQGDLQQWMVVGGNSQYWPTTFEHADYGAPGGGGGYFDVNVDYKSGTMVAMTFNDQVYLNGKYEGSGVYGAYAGTNGNFFEVTTNATLYQWSPQAHESYYYNPWTYSWIPYWTNWTYEDSNVQFG
jgi:hypothetical protein